MNLTAAGGSGAAGYVTAYACGTPLPLASNLNFAAGQIVANAAVVPVAADGSLCLHANTPTDLVVDVAGAVTDNYVADRADPAARHARGQRRVTTAAVAAGRGRRRRRRPERHRRRRSDAAGFVTVYPADVAQPPTSNVNFQRRPDRAQRRRGAPRRRRPGRSSASTPVHLVIDTFGAFLCSAAPRSLGTVRRLTRTSPALPAPLRLLRLDQLAVGTDDEPHAAGALAVGVAGGGVTGEPVQRPLAGLQLVPPPGASTVVMAA